MAKLLKHLGIGVKKTGSSGSSHRSSDYNAQKSNSVQELLPKSPTRYRSSSSLSTGNQEYDTHSLKLFPVDPTNHQRQPYNDGNNHHQRPPSYATNGRHDHRHGAGGGGGGGGSTRSKEQKSLSPKANCNTDAYYTSYTGGIESAVPEEREVFDSLSDASVAAESPSTHTATPPRLLDEYCDPLDLKKVVSDGTELLGAIAPTPAIEDDYSVPYEVKKILKGVRPKERYGSSGSTLADGSQLVNGTLGRSSSDMNGSLMEDSFDEPWEWSAKLSALVAQNPSLYPQGNCLTPMMTPKKTGRPYSPKTDATHDDGGKSVANGDIRSSFNADMMTSGSSEDDLEDPGRKNEVTAFDRQASLLSPDGVDEQQGKDPSASVGGRDHSSLSKSDIVTPDRIGSVDGSSGGLLIITEIPPIIDVDPYDCHIIIPDLTRCQPDADSAGSSLPDHAEPPAAAAAAVVATNETDGAAKCDRSFQNAAKEKHDRSDYLVSSRSWSSASESLVSSTTPRKCSHGSSKQNQSHHNDFGHLKPSKSTPSKSGGCTNAKSSQIIASAAAAAVPLSSSCSNTKERINADIALEQQCWYHGSIGRVEAEELLQPEKEGSFLVRMSESSKLDYSLSLKSGRGFLHMKIVNLDGKFILGQFSQPFDSIPHMVEFYCMSKLPIKGSENISLIHPLAANECCSL